MCCPKEMTMEKLATGKETNRIEFKRELNDKLERVVVSFLNNSEGGEIYIGVDNDGSVVGVENPDDIQLMAKDRIKNNIIASTLGLFDVLSNTENGKKYIKINIASGPEKPYYISKYGMPPKGCFMRIGSSTEPMPQNVIEDFFSKRTRNSIGKIKSPKQNLTFEQLKIYYEENNLKLNDHFAENLELLTENDKFNYAAYLLSDTNGISIKVAKYSGDDRYDLIENNEYGYCSLIKATKNVLAKLEIENPTLTKITSKERKEHNLVDKIALREAVINAIVHNDYTNEIPPKVEIFSDRIEITSAGGLVQGMTEEEFFSGYSAPRNKELMRIFKDINLVEQLGSGMIRILKNYNRSIFTITPNFVKVTFPFKKPKNKKIPDGGLNGGLNYGLNYGLNDGLKSLFDVISSNPGIKAKELGKLLGNRSINTIEWQIKVLIQKGLIERRGSKKTGGYYPAEDKQD